MKFFAIITIAAIICNAPAWGETIFHYRFNIGPDGASIDAAMDSGPNSLNTTDTSGVTFTDNTVDTPDSGNFALNAYCDFDFIQVADDPAMRVDGDFTLEAYVFPSHPYGGDSRRGHAIVTKKSGELGTGISSYALGYDQIDQQFSGSIDFSSDT